MVRTTLLLLSALSLPLAAQEETPRVYTLEELDGLPRATNVPEFEDALRSGYPAASASPAATVVVSFLVDREGGVRDPSISSTSDSAFDAGSLAAVRVLRFEPATAGGEPVAVRLMLPLEWRAAAYTDTAAAPEDAEPPEELHVAERMPRLLNGHSIGEMLLRRLPEWPIIAPPRLLVVVRIRISPEGRVTAAEMVRGTGRERVDSAILQVARRLRYAPATLNGRGVAVWAEQPLDLAMPEQVPELGEPPLPRP